LKKITLISIWADPSHYINLLFLINYLIKKRQKTILICKSIENKRDFYYFIKKSPYLEIKIIKRNSRMGMIEFFLTKLYYVFRFRPSKIIAINFISLFFTIILKFFLKKIYIIYYNFDFDISEKLKINNNIEKLIINLDKVIIIISKKKTKLYKKIYKLKKKIYPLYNCFSKLFKPKKKLLSKKFIKKKIFIRLGSYNEGHNLEELIRSTKYWKKNCILIMAGISHNNYLCKLKKIKKKFRLSKVTMMEKVTYKMWFKLLNNAYAGFALYEPINISHKNMAGTSQKLNNYFFSNKPAIATKSLDFIKFNKKFKTLLLVDSSSEYDIARKVNELSINKKKYRKLKKNTLNVFNNIFNFEKQVLQVSKILD